MQCTHTVLVTDVEEEVPVGGEDLPTPEPRADAHCDDISGLEEIQQVALTAEGATGLPAVLG